MTTTSVSALRLLTGLLMAAATLAITPATASELSEALASPDYILLMRHADAPGVGDPPGYAIGDCSTQRNLGERGKKQAADTGKWLRAEGVTTAVVYTSPWCRCVDTGNLLGFAPAIPDKSLGSFFNDPMQSGQSTTGLRKLVATALKQKGKKALILVTHQVNITDFVGQAVGSGEMILARVDAQGNLLSHRTYPGR